MVISRYIASNNHSRGGSLTLPELLVLRTTELRNWLPYFPVIARRLAAAVAISRNRVLLCEHRRWIGYALLRCNMIMRIILPKRHTLPSR